MRTTIGPSQRIVIVGAGLGGLAAALHLAGAGRQVTVVEREAEPGGRCGVEHIGGYRFDTGPTVLTLPHLIDEALAAVGEQREDWLRLTPLSPAYRAHFADGTKLSIYADVDQMATEIEQVIGREAVTGYRSFVDFAGKLYDIELPHFIDRNFDSALDLANLNSLRLLRMGGFRRLQSVVEELMPDPRLQRIFSFQSMYAGLAPAQALAIYAVIAYMDTVAGVFSVEGGMHALPRALAAAAEKHGVEFRYNCEVTGVEVTSGRATSVRTADGDRLPCDAVVLNPDIPAAWQLLDGVRPPKRLKRLKFSPSCVVLHVGTKRRREGLAHHNIHFGHAWSSTFDELIDQRRLMSDPSLLLTSPTASDPSSAPDNGATYYVLVPVPNEQSGLNWERLAPRYRDEIVAHLETLGYDNFAADIDCESFWTPADWQSLGMAAGTPFAAAHTFAQTGPWRPGNLALDNVVFTGSGTQPGVGVPMVLISGKLAAERIVGSKQRKPRS